MHFLLHFIGCHFRYSLRSSGGGGLIIFCRKWNNKFLRDDFCPFVESVFFSLYTSLTSFRHSSNTRWVSASVQCWSQNLFTKLLINLWLWIKVPSSWGIFFTKKERNDEFYIQRISWCTDFLAVNKLLYIRRLDV